MNNLLYFGLLCYSLYSVVVYFLRRTENRAALRHTTVDAEPIRTLNEAERAALQDAKLGPLLRKPLKFDSTSVYELQGSYERHGIKSVGGGGGESMHDTIGDVEVIFPYDAKDFLQGYNKAEVVRVKKYAIIVKLNDGFDLLAAHQRHEAEMQRQRNWEQGQLGPVRDESEIIDGNEIDDAQQYEADSAEEKLVEEAFAVEILEQRMETLQETDARAINIGMLPVLCWIAVFGALLLMKAFPSAEIPLLCSCLTGVALALWLSWRRTAQNGGKVNRVRGMLVPLELGNSNTNEVTSYQIWLGTQFKIVFPVHWAKAGAAAIGEKVELDMRVSDYSVLNFPAKKLSIDQEISKWPLQRWGRHLTLCLTGLFVILPVWFTADNLKEDFSYTKIWLAHSAPFLFGNPAPLSFNSSAALAGKVFSIGTDITVIGKGRCEVVAERDNTIDCHRVRWDGAIPQAPETVTMDDNTQALFEGSFLDTHLDVMAEMVKMQMLSQSDLNPINKYRLTSRSLLSVENIKKTVDIINAACPEKQVDSMIDDACATLKDGFTDALQIEDEEQERQWKAMNKASRWKQLNEKAAAKPGDDDAAYVLFSDEPAGILKNAHEVAQQRIKQAIAKAVRGMEQSQHGGIVLQKPWSDLPVIDQNTPQETTVQDDPTQAAPATPVATSTGNDPSMASSITARMQPYAQLTQPDGLKPFHINGIVTAYGHDDKGTTVLTIDTRVLNQQYQVPALARTALSLCALYLLLVHGTMAIVKLYASSRRQRMVADYVNNFQFDHENVKQT